MYTAGKFSEDLGAFVRFLSDSTFIRAIMAYWGNNSLTCEGCGRVMHGGESYYYNARADLMEFPASDVTTLKRFVGFMINFVKTLNPTPRRENLFQNLTWPRVTPDNFSIWTSILIYQ
ncbi:hypothetical protein JTB14_032582 [Gonioctena quinquepunctata]|nr:hypothetical protein JTB14_032582 [Gonioctena quinquepunctata]